MNERLMALRAAFDEAFARTPDDPVETEDLLVVGAGGQRFALPLGGLAGVELTPPLTPLTSSQPALLGLANCRGRVTPVFSLARLLGAEPAVSPTEATEAASPHDRMCALVVSESRDWVAFGFEHLFELARVPMAHDAATTGKVLRTASGVVPIVDITDLKNRVVTRHEEN